MKKKTKIVFLWDNYGPMHDDRVRAVAEFFEKEEYVDISAIEIFGSSEVYAWDVVAGEGFEKVTLFPQGKATSKSLPFLKAFFGIMHQAFKLRATHLFFCHYNQTVVFVSALVLRLLGKNLYTMSCSKFDDYERNIGREWLKKFFFIPYKGAISSGNRSKDYMRLMGIPEDKIFTEYNTLSINRIQKLSGKEAAPNGTSFFNRHFTIVARLVPKKNLKMAIDAYYIYSTRVEKPRPLHICGSGELEESLRKHAKNLGLENLIEFRGFIQSDVIARTLGDTLVLLLPSIEEQFGNVVIEAQAMGLPVILSDNCGARDNLIRSGLNGFVVEPDNPMGLAFFMGLLDSDQALWKKMSLEANEFASKGDVARFVDAVKKLTNT